MTGASHPPHLPDDGHELPHDSLAAQITRDAAVCADAVEVALRHEAAVTAWLLRRLERRLA